MKNLLTRAAKLFVAALMIFTLAPTKIIAEGTSAIAISDKNAAVEVHLYKDDKQSTEISGTTTTISRTDKVHGTLAVVFNSENQPTADKLSYSYTFPNNIKITDFPSAPLMNGSETAGTWNIKDNVLTFTYDPKWIAAGHTSNIKANFHFDFTVVNNTSIDSKSSEIKFAGVAAPITIHYDDGHVTGSKTANVNSDNTITFTINITADKDCSLNLTDTMGSNLAFVDGSFKLDGNTVLNPTVDGQTMTLSKYALKAGKHQITYKATVIDPSLDTNNDGNIDNVGNDAKWTWDAVTTQQGAPINPTISYNNAMFNQMTDIA